MMFLSNYFPVNSIYTRTGKKMFLSGIKDFQKLLYVKSIIVSILIEKPNLEYVSKFFMLSGRRESYLRLNFRKSK